MASHILLIIFICAANSHAQAKVKQLSNTTVRSSEELQAAIDRAIPGDTIILGTKRIEGGHFILNASGHPSEPITIRTEDPNTKIIGNGDGTAFTVLGKDWNFHSFTVSGYDLAFSVKGAGNSIHGIVVEKCKKAMDIEGTNTAMEGFVVNSGTVRIAANNSVLSGTIINGDRKHPQEPVLTIEGGTCCGRVSGNTINGPVVLKGNEYKFSSNIIQGEYFKVKGCHNSFSGQMSPKPETTDKCSNHFSKGNMFT